MCLPARCRPCVFAFVVAAVSVCWCVAGFAVRIWQPRCTRPFFRVSLRLSDWEVAAKGKGEGLRILGHPLLLLLLLLVSSTHPSVITMATQRPVHKPRRHRDREQRRTHTTLDCAAQPATVAAQSHWLAVAQSLVASNGEGKGKAATGSRQRVMREHDATDADRLRI